MADSLPTTELPFFLQRCIDEGLIEEDKARSIDAFRRSSGLRLAQSLNEAGVLPVGASVDDLAGSESGPELCDPLLFPVPPSPTMTFDSFVVCQANTFPIELAKTVATDQSRRAAYNPLYLYGPVGSGKTHLLSAVANVVGESSLLVNTEDLNVEHERACRLRCRAEMRRWLGSFDLLMLDDIQACEGNEDLQRELFSLLNHHVRAGKAAVIASDVPPTRLRGMESRLISRLGGGVIVALQLPDQEERREILKRLDGGELFTNEVLDYMSDRVRSNVRGLKAVGKQLVALARTTSTDIDIDLVRAVVPEPMDMVHPFEPASPPEATTARPAAAAGHSTTEAEPAAGASTDPGTAPEESAQQATRFKQMLAEAETEEEQALALQIALGERVRELRAKDQPTPELRKLEDVLRHLRDGRLHEACEALGMKAPASGE